MSYNTIHETEHGAYYVATHPSEALPAVWEGPVREWPIEAARDLGGIAAEALINYLADDEQCLPGELTVIGTAAHFTSYGELGGEFPGVEFHVDEIGLRARL